MRLTGSLFLFQGHQIWGQRRERAQICHEDVMEEIETEPAGKQ